MESQLNYVIRSCDEVNFTELLGILDHYLENEGTGYTLMLDFRSAKSVSLNVENCADLARDYFAGRIPTIIIADKPHFFGVARMIEGFSGGNLFRVCRTDEEALQFVIKGLH